MHLDLFPSSVLRMFFSYLSPLPSVESSWPFMGVQGAHTAPEFGDSFRQVIVALEALVWRAAVERGKGDS